MTLTMTEKLNECQAETVQFMSIEKVYNIIINTISKTIFNKISIIRKSQSSTENLSSQAISATLEHSNFILSSFIMQ